MPDRKYWQQKLRDVTQLVPEVSAFAAFNTNIDAVVHLSPELLLRAIDKSGADLSTVERRACDGLPATVATPTDFLVVLRAELAEGKSCHVVVEESLLPWISDVFAECTESMGGQAGIIANQMAALHAKSVVYTRLLSPQQARMFDERVLTPVVSDEGMVLTPVRDAAREADEVKVNWIFEYAKGLSFQFGSETVTTPRANRVIMATRPQGAVMAFSSEMDQHLSSLGKLIDVAFMAGYHYAAPEGNDGRDFASYMAYIQNTLGEMTRHHPDLRIHYEYVPLKHEVLECEVLRVVCDSVNSFGINENEIRRALRKLGYAELAEAIDVSERAYTLYQGALALLNELKLDRLHLHNLGYYVVVVRKPYFASVSDVMDASLYATALNAIKAKYGGYPTSENLAEAAQMPLSDVGYAQLEMFGQEIGDVATQKAPGIWEFEDHYALVTPAHIFPNPVSTVGMGDTISSASYAMEVYLASVNAEIV